MAIITNYATLQTEVANALARDDLTDDIPLFIQLCERKLYRTLNLRNEETALSVSISSGVAAVPSDFKALKFAYYSTTPAQLLQWVPVEELYRDYPDRSDTDTPLVISREATNFVFGPISSDGTLAGVYYAKLAALSDSNTTNWYTTNAPDALFYGSLLEAAPFLGADERIATWQAYYTSVIDSLREEQRQAESSRGQLMERVS